MHQARCSTTNNTALQCPEPQNAPARHTSQYMDRTTTAAVHMTWVTVMQQKPEGSEPTLSQSQRKVYSDQATDCSAKARKQQNTPSPERTENSTGNMEYSALQRHPARPHQETDYTLRNSAAWNFRQIENMIVKRFRSFLGSFLFIKKHCLKGFLPPAHPRLRAFLDGLAIRTCLEIAANLETRISSGLHLFWGHFYVQESITGKQNFAPRTTSIWSKFGLACKQSLPSRQFRVLKSTKGRQPLMPLKKWSLRSSLHKHCKSMVSSVLGSRHLMLV